jgi:hypothetical protein
MRYGQAVSTLRRLVWEMRWPVFLALIAAGAVAGLYLAGVPYP